MNDKMLQVLACPCCHAKLRYDKENQRLICEYEQLAYPIEQGIPILLPESGVTFSQQEGE